MARRSSGREPPPAEREWLTRVHGPALVDAIERLCAAGGGRDRLRHGRRRGLVGGGAAGGRRRRRGRSACCSPGEHDFAFCGLRPPGHHAESNRAMGFCLFNNAAVGAAHAIAACGAERVLILDWDVHHGNGTAEIFDRRDDVLYVSIHQSPLYPGTGAAGEIGSGAGDGTTAEPAGAARRGRGGVRRPRRARRRARPRARIAARPADRLGRLRRPRRRSARQLPARGRTTTRR